MNKEFLEFLYESAGMQRWNDHIRPHKGFTELDKQSHKMLFAYTLAKYEESDKGREVDWKKLIEGGIFELFHRITLTDIKPPVFHKLMTKKGTELNHWVIEKLEERGFYKLPGNLRENIKQYYFNPDYCPLERKILKASHYLATNWEFKIVYRLCSGFYGLEETKRSIEDEMEDHYDLAGVQKIALGGKTMNFLDLIGQMRFQQRWSQTPRIPETSVLGHMLIVAVMSYIASLEIGACPKRLYNNYFAGLFHDLPEMLTRDIISPIKSSVDELDNIIKDIEKIQIEEKIFPLIPSSWHDELQYFTMDEFDNKIIENKKPRPLKEIDSKYNMNSYSPLDGNLVKGCDKLAVFLEAYFSIKYGIDTHFLREGCESTYEEFKKSIVSGYDLGKVFREFDMSILR